MAKPDDSGLFIFEGEALRFVFRFEHCGVTLSDDRIGWDAGAGVRDYALSDIVSIRLQAANAGRDMIGTCQIRFRDGITLNVHGGTRYGGADPRRADRFREFVRDLHRQLAAIDHRTIVFRAGVTDGRYKVMTAAMAAAGIMFVLLPVGLLIVVPSWHTLAVGAGAASLFYGFYRLWEKSRPRSYSPRDVPEDILA